MGSKQKSPEPRNIGQETRDTLQAQIDLAPEQLAAEREFGPGFAEAELGRTATSLFGTDDTRGLLDLLEQDISPTLDRVSAASALAQRTGDIESVEALGGRSRDALRAADPQTAALLDQLNLQATQGLQAGAQLSPDEVRSIQQQSRAAGSARGNLRGPGGSLDEILRLQLAGQGRQRERQGFAGQIAQANQAFTGDTFLQVLGRPSNVNPLQSQSIFGSAAGVGANAGRFDPFGGPGASLQNAISGQNFQAQTDAAIGAQNRSAGIFGGLLGAAGNIGGSLLGNPNLFR